MKPFVINKRCCLLVEQVFGCIETLWLDGMSIRDIPLAIGPVYNQVALQLGFPVFPLRPDFQVARRFSWEDSRPYPDLVEYVLMEFLRRNPGANCHAWHEDEVTAFLGARVVRGCRKVEK